MPNWRAGRHLSTKWIVQRTGIKQRHIAAEGEFTSHLRSMPARAALAQMPESKRSRSHLDRAGDLDTG